MKKAFQNLIRNYFDFTKGERNAFFVLCIILILVILYPFIFQTHRAQVPVDFSAINELEARQDDRVSQEERDAETENFQEYPERMALSKKFMFNPNTASQKELEALGIKSFLAQRIIRFRNAGGKFFIKSDLARIYGLSKEQLEELMPYVDLPESREAVYAKRRENEASENTFIPALIDINTADTATLNRLRGIGNKLSMRIVAFREKLGGFYSIEQLGEVYGLRPEVIAEIQPRFKKEIQPYRFIDINKATVEEMGSHPYIRRQLAGIIVNYRTQHVPFASVDDLMNIKVLDEAGFLKVKNYLRV